MNKYHIIEKEWNTNHCVCTIDNKFACGGAGSIRPNTSESELP